MKVFIMDMLCMVPFYDAYLCSALQRNIPDLKLGSISFHLQPDYFAKKSVHRQRGLIDLVARLPLRSSILRQSFKFAEYLLNLLLLTVRFLFTKPDIIHVEWIPIVVKTPVELWFLRFMQKRGVRLVYTVHNILPHDSGDRFKQKFQKVYNMMDMLICHTAQTRNDLQQLFSIPEQKTVVIPHGPLFHDSVPLTTGEARQRLGITTNKVVAVYFGVIRPYKGLEFLLDAWKKVADQTSGEAVLLIAGNGQKEYLDTIAASIKEMCLEDAVVTDFRFIPSEELPLLIQAADILVYPYKNVTQSGALLTGMFFGKAIIATNVGGFTETLEHDQTALLVDYGDCMQLVDSLVRLINSQADRQRLGQAVREYLEMCYSWEHIAEQTIAVYNRLLSSGTTGGSEHSK